MKRSGLIDKIAVIILQQRPNHPLRVAIDGVDASGKTCLADELAKALRSQPRQVIRASVDGFHNPKHIRRQKGSFSPEGFYRDSYNYPALIGNLLKPLGPEGDRRYRTAVFDVRQELPLTTPAQTAPRGAILIMDGIFLLRPELLTYWDLKIFLDANFSNTVSRGVARDAEFIGSAAEAKARYAERYVPGQQIYLSEAHPLDKANVLIDNNIFDEPKLIRAPLDSLSN
jgi:uridine kinase